MFFKGKNTLLKAFARSSRTRFDRDFFSFDRYVFVFFRSR